MLVEQFSHDAFVLKAFAIDVATDLIEQIHQLTKQSPFRQMATPHGHKIAVAMTNCGQYGWISDQRGYRYEKIDPETHHAWPVMPELFQTMAKQAAKTVGFSIEPDVCLINRYRPGLKMGLHRDIDEQDMTAPIVSISLGIPAMFQFGGPKRSDPTTVLLLSHGDVVVWGGLARKNYHGIKAVKLAQHPLTGQVRYNLTFRKAK